MANRCAGRKAFLSDAGWRFPRPGHSARAAGTPGYANCATLGAALNRYCTSRPTEQFKGSAVGRLASRTCSGAGRCALRPPCARVGSGLGFTNRGEHRFRSPECRSCRSRQCLGPHRAELGKVTSGDSIVASRARPAQVDAAFSRVSRSANQSSNPKIVCLAATDARQSACLSEATGSVSGRMTPFTIHDATGIPLSQSDTDGIRRQSSRTCCSATKRTGTSLPSELKSVRPNVRCASKIPRL